MWFSGINFAIGYDATSRERRFGVRRIAGGQRHHTSAGWLLAASGRDSKGISKCGGIELISSHFQWISVDGTSYQMIVSGCQWMAVDVSGS